MSGWACLFCAVYGVCLLLHGEGGVVLACCAHALLLLLLSFLSPLAAAAEGLCPSLSPSLALLLFALKPLHRSLFALLLREMERGAFKMRLTL